ncbi:hypothetical protein like AT3G26020 [Hibiscus trionum]|uniref:Uncharacterized protein n=1 Tax=Hibiscus trionum TaxID=183268 RepID=A0A9W7M2U9_HIBTR|nr:hypothetical protein like AT3G26020 [Hibiscus trionum]
MFKQILRKLPRKSSKNSESRDHGGNNATYSSVYGGSRSGDLVSEKSGYSSVSYSTEPNSSADVGWKGSDTKPCENNVFSGYEALPAFKDVPASEKQKLFIKKIRLFIKKEIVHKKDVLVL